MDDYAFVGKRSPRIDGLIKTVGEAKYSPDIVLPRMLYGKILRSPYPHARILQVDASKAFKIKGVKAILTAENVPLSPYIKSNSPMAYERVLALDKVRFAGEEVAAVAAIDLDTAEEALELVEVEYEELPRVSDPLEAMKPDSARVHYAENNIAFNLNIEGGNVEEAFSQSDCILEDTFIAPSTYQAYMEPIGCVAKVDSSGKVTLWMGGMYPSGVRMHLSKVLDIRESNIRVIQTYVGGAFGGKINSQPIFPICVLLAKETGRPVRLVNSREEEFFATRPSIGEIVRMKIGVRKDGKIMARQSEIIGDNGAYIDYGHFMLGRSCSEPDSLYRIPNYKATGKLIYTNKAPVGPFRGFGAPQVFFAFESLLDMAAEQISVDPVEMRLKNAVQEGDITALGRKLKSCGLSDCIKECAKAAGWKQKRLKKLPCRGIGVACTTYPSDARFVPGFSGSVIFVKILEDGKVNIVTGEAEYGQGSYTVFGQIVAEELRVTVEDIEITSPDTDITPYALGPWGGGRMTISGGNAVRLAAIDARRQLFEVAGEMLEANVEDLEISDRKIYVKGSPEKRISISDVARTSTLEKRWGSAIIGKGVDERDTTVPIDPDSWFGNYSSAYSFTVEIGEVEVDPDTGAVKLLNLTVAHDIGKIINPTLAEGQLEGAISQGIGLALGEELKWQNGMVINPNFSDYRFPISIQMPPIRNIFVESKDPNGPYGAKGIGIPARVPIPAVIANAIYDAVGIRIKELPITAQRVLENGVE